jgi:hypothetical protein
MGIVPKASGNMAALLSEALHQLACILSKDWEFVSSAKDLAL